MRSGADGVGVSKGCISPAAIAGGSGVAGETRGKVEKSTPRVESGAFGRRRGFTRLFMERRNPGEGKGVGSPRVTRWCSHCSSASTGWAQPWGHLHKGVTGIGSVWH